MLVPTPTTFSFLVKALEGPTLLPLHNDVGEYVLLEYGHFLFPNEDEYNSKQKWHSVCSRQETDQYLSVSVMSNYFYNKIDRFPNIISVYPEHTSGYGSRLPLVLALLHWIWVEIIRKVEQGAKIFRITTRR
jgi:hypothetical protein